MPYRRPPQNNKRFLPPLFTPFGSQRRTNTQYEPGNGMRREYLDIPLPNELEFSGGAVNDNFIVRGLSSAVDYIREHIKIEELILIGLIILLLEEAKEDQLLLIIFIYILLF